ncbi:hypothetical protein WJT74_11110 [Sphingomicrobium sp. XHP0239]|uniref:hypothetical protein n=1 Tax=Sphingomicrobium maritimum TaxID=3133972 RepID=UPI0031CC623D
MKAFLIALVPALALAACGDTDSDGSMDDTALDPVPTAPPGAEPAVQEEGTIDPGDPAATGGFNTNRGEGASDVDAGVGETDAPAADSNPPQ